MVRNLILAASVAPVAATSLTVPAQAAVFRGFGVHGAFGRFGGLQGFHYGAYRGGGFWRGGYYHGGGYWGGGYYHGCCYGGAIAAGAAGAAAGVAVGAAATSAGWEVRRTPLPWLTTLPREDCDRP